jgi:hypothetical protein
MSALRNELNGRRAMEIKERSEEVKLAIKYNNVGVSGVCPICGSRTEPKIPLAIFLEDSWTVVCDECGEKFAPEIHALLNIFYALPLSQRRTWVNLRLRQGR